MKLYGSKRNHEKDENYNKKKGQALRRALTVVGVIAVVVLVVVIGYTIWEKPPAIDKGSSGQNDSSVSGGNSSDGTGVNPDDGIYAEALSTDRNDGVYTILIVGRDKASNSTDTIMVGKFDTVNSTIDVVNIPRDTLINISWKSTPKKINAVYPGYTNSGESGIEGLKTHLKNILGFGIDCYAVVSLEAVEKTIDEIGGIYFDVPIDMDYDDSSQHFHVHLKAGYQLLNGYETLGVFRYRYSGQVEGNTSGSGYAGGDLDRIKVQQDLLKAVASQMLSLGNIPNLTNVIQILVDNVETDLSAANMAFFARQFLKCKMADISFHTAPADYAVINGVSYVSLKNDEWLQLLNDYINPYKEDITLANVNILNSDYTGSSVSSTTGTIAGGIDSFYCATCTYGNGGRAVWHTPGGCYAPQPEVTEAPDIGDLPAPPEVTEAPVEPEAPVITEVPALPETTPDQEAGFVG